MRCAVAEREVHEVQGFGKLLTCSKMQTEAAAHQAQVERENIRRLGIVDRRFDERLGPVRAERITKRRKAHACGDIRQVSAQHTIDEDDDVAIYGIEHAEGMAVSGQRDCAAVRYDRRQRGFIQQTGKICVAPVLHATVWKTCLRKGIHRRVTRGAQPIGTDGGQRITLIAVSLDKCFGGVCHIRSQSSTYRHARA